MSKLKTEKIDGLNEHQKDAFDYLVEFECYDEDDALALCDEVVIYYDMDMRDVAYEFVQNGYYGDVPESLQYYIDYDAIARDLRCDGRFYEYNGNVYERCF